MKSREPVKHTCPDIDKAIKAIGAAYMETQFEESDDIESLREKLQRIETELYGLDSDLEDLRKCNSALRDWGNEEAEQVDKLEDKINELENALEEKQ